MRAIYVVSIVIYDFYLPFRSRYEILLSFSGLEFRGFGSEVFHSGIRVIYFILKKTNDVHFISQ
jgi:hypothetical protein